MAASRYADRFLLKGALLFSLWYDEPHRPTRDADLLGFGPADGDILVANFRKIVAIRMDDGVAFDPESVPCHSYPPRSRVRWHSPVAERKNQQRPTSRCRSMSASAMR